VTLWEDEEAVETPDPSEAFEYLFSTADLKAPWRDESACGEIYKDPDKTEYANAWIQEDHPLRAEATAICADCPVRYLCIKDAMEEKTLDNELAAHGLRAGVFFDRGRLLSQDRAKAQREFGLKIKVRQTPRAGYTPPSDDE
jgi:hypothetical protein